MSINVFDVGEITIDFNAAEVYNSGEDYMRDVLDDDEDEEYIDLDGVGGNREFAPSAPLRSINYGNSLSSNLNTSTTSMRATGPSQTSMKRKKCFGKKTELSRS